MPRYIKPLPPSLGSDDIQHLHRKKVFSLPTPEFRNACLQSYVEWVHFFCPVLELRDFLGSIATPTESSEDGVSLMLFYAVLLTGVAFVDENCILEAGYGSRFAVRKEFFTKAKVSRGEVKSCPCASYADTRQKQKLLYSFGCELDRKVLVQTLLLMSYFQESHDEPTNHWYWAELGCVMARSIGLFLDPMPSSLSAGQKRLWKRIGWSCILRDRVLNLGVRMPPKVRQEEFQVPILLEEDFEPMVFSSAVTTLLPHCELVRDESLQRHLARMCIEKTKLCILLGDLFNCLYKEGSPKLGETSEVTLILLPQSDNLDMAAVAMIENDLQCWVRNLPAAVQNLQLKDAIMHSKEKIAFAHCSMLHMFYQTILCAFYRPQILAASPAVAHETTQRMRHATMMLTRHFEDLQSYDLIRFLPSSAVTFLLTAAVNHLVEYKTVEEDDARERHLRRFRDCLCFLKTLQTVHVYAKYGGIFLTSSARQQGIAVPQDAASVTETDNVPTSPTDREGLGPWAVAHTPDVLIRDSEHIPPRRHARDVQDTWDDSSSEGVHKHAAAGERGGHQQAANENLLNQFSSPEDMEFQSWPGVDQDTEACIGVANITTSPGFLQGTLWEHGWIDQIAENWVQVPELEHPGFCFSNVPDMNQ
jgi:hypothetical protein